MATTQERSDEMTNAAATPPVLNRASKGGHQAVKKTSTHIQGAAAGDIGSTIDICSLPGGSRVDMHQSSLRNTAHGTSVTLSIGWRAYQLPNGTVVAENAIGLCSGIVTAGAGYRQLVEAPTLGAGLDPDDTRLFEGPVVLFATTAGGIIAAGARSVFRIVYAETGD